MAIFRAQGIRAKAWVSSQRLRCIDHPEEPLPQRVGGDRGDKVAAVSAPEDLVGNDARMAGVKKVAAGIDQQSQLGIEERHIESLSGPGFFPRQQRRKDP